ncbi:MAG TPA: TonB-dependent receptor [Chitinophagales bacterium]|nr:TonB-dependent receptor [Chitinophagales bacterium]
MKNYLYSSCMYVLLSLFGLVCYATNTYTFKGNILSQQTHKAIAFANIYDSTSRTFSTTDSLGKFEIRLAAGKYNFEFSCIGFNTIFREVNITKDSTIDISLQEIVQLDGVTVAAEKINKTATMSTSGVTTLSSMSVEKLPAFFGEKDIMKAILLTPGIQSGQEGARGIFVRGGSPDQNLMLFHHATVFNASHIYGFLSVFTTESLKKMDIYKSYIPVQYGGRLSSVLNIEPNFGNTETWKGDYSISFITQKFHIEGPLKKEKTSFNFSIRDCHAGFFTEPIAAKQYKRNGENGTLKYFFYDINAAIQHHVNDKNTLSWSLYTGSDFFTFGEGKEYKRTTKYSKDYTQRKLSWQNIANSIEWKTNLKKQTIYNAYAYSFYNLSAKQQFAIVERNYTNLSNDIHKTQYNNASKINEHKWLTMLEHAIKDMHHLNYGIKFNARTFHINTIDAKVYDSTNNIIQSEKYVNPKVNTLDFYAFADYRFTWKNKLELNAGMQLFLYHVNKKSIFYPQPRAELIYHPINGMSLRAAVSRTVQPMHLLTNNTGDILNDIWVPATSKIKPETAWQYAGGIQYDHPKGYSASIDAYYKTMHHLSEYKYGTTFIVNNMAWDEQLLNSGTGKAYGLELFFAKTKGQFTAWLKYNLGWSKRQYPELNDGKTFYYKYDRRHDISIILQYKLKKHFDFTMAWTYGTGWRMTTPNTTYASDETLYNYDRNNEPLTGSQDFMTVWNERNNYVLPAYHHLDIGMNYTKQAKRVKHVLNISIYNVYNHMNIFTVFRDSEIDELGNKTRQYKQLSMFPIIPSIGYTISFEIKKEK